MIKEFGAHPPVDGARIFLTDTLESSNEEHPLPSSFFERPLAEERRRAKEVKREKQILVCIGNPPYEREEGVDSKSEGSGGWIRYGDTTTKYPPIDDFVGPAKRAGAGVHVKNIYNLYVYFWRWALWKVLETQQGPGIVCFITASSYLRGPGFVGMREELRRAFDELWILDLEGDGRGTRRSENVFNIQTPVAIAVGIRYGESKRDQSAIVHYSLISGTRSEKYDFLNSIESTASVEWEQVPSEFHEPLAPVTQSRFTDWPKVTDLFPWQHSGAQLKRLWPIGESRELLEERWKILLNSRDQGKLFRETRDRQVTRSYPDQLGDGGLLPGINSLPSNTPAPEIVRYGYRSFDRQWVIKDTRVGDRSRPPLWKIFDTNQIYIISLFSRPLGSGPGVVFTDLVPDMDYFRGSFGAKAAIPLFRSASIRASTPNIVSGLIDHLAQAYEITVNAEDVAAYLAAVMGHSGYTNAFRDELEHASPRVPFTKNRSHFQRAIEVGKQVIAWHTYAERFPESIGATRSVVPTGSARITTAIPDHPESYPRDMSDVVFDSTTRELRVGEGVVVNVDPRVWEYEVSGFKVVRSWLGYRMKKRSGKKSSPLDDIRPERWTWEMTRELLELLHVLEGVISFEPEQALLLDEIVAGDLFLADELPIPTDAERKAPTFATGLQPGLGLPDDD